MGEANQQTTSVAGGQTHECRDSNSHFEAQIAWRKHEHTVGNGTADAASLASRGVGRGARTTLQAGDMVMRMNN